MFTTTSLSLLALSLPLASPYCTWVGSNPSWEGPPSVEQVSLTSVRVSWRGLLQREDCADSLLVKYYKRDNTNDFGMSNELSVSTNSYIIRDVVPNIPYTFQVIAREEKGLLGVDYNKSPKTVFTTRKTNVVVEKEDPLPASKVDDNDDTDKNEDDVIPVYNPEPTNQPTIINGEIKDNDVLGMKLEVFMGIVIGSLIVFTVAVGILYNIFKKNQTDKDIELQFDSDSEDEDDDEEEEEEECGKDNEEGEKYNMMLPEKQISDKMSPLQSAKFTHSNSSLT